VLAKQAEKYPYTPDLGNASEGNAATSKFDVLYSREGIFY
jgi:hypothetical protein